MDAQRTLYLRDENGEVVFALEAAAPDEIAGHVKISIGGFERTVSAASSVEFGRQFLNAGSYAHGIPKVAA